MATRKRAFAPETVEKLLGDIPELRDFLQFQAELLEVGMGVIRNGREISGLWPFRFSKFCDLVRKSPQGRRACVESDTRACRLCQGKPIRERIGDFKRFRCHMRLIDIPSPIIVRGNLFAHLFAGQMRTEKRTPDVIHFLRTRFERLSLGNAGVTFRSLLAAYDKLKMRALDDLREVDSALCRLADFIGVVAGSVDVLRAIGELSSDLTPLVDMNAGLMSVYQTVSTLLGADSGSLWLAHRNDSSSPGFGYATVLRPQQVHWFGEADNVELRDHLQLKVGQGIAGWIAQHKKPRRCTNAREIQEIPAVHPGLRQRRRLRSLIGTPITSQGSLLGVLEVGSKKEAWFSRGHEQLIEILGGIAANFVRRTKERELIVEMHSKRSSWELFAFLEKELPPLFGALAASVFTPETRGHNVLLVPAFPDGIVKGLGPGAALPAWDKVYDLERGEGLTGWVGRYGICLRLKHCNSSDEIRSLYESGHLADRNGNSPPTPPRWLGKTRAATEDRKDATRHADRPLMICPSSASNRRLLAVVRVCEREGLPFSNADEAFLRNICEQIAVCLERLSRQREIAKEETAWLVTQSTHDFGRFIDSAQAAVKAAITLTERSGDMLDLRLALKEAERRIAGLWAHVDQITTAIRRRKSPSLPPGAVADIRSAVDEVLAETRAQAHDAAQPDIDFAFRVDPALVAPCLNIDGERFKRHLGNILINSIKAVRRAKKQKGTITVALDQLREGWFRLLVEDNGDGFRGDIVPLINHGELIPIDSRFGFGISLQDCKEYVETTLAGDFCVSNRTDGGATVEWVFPSGQAGVNSEPVEIKQVR